MISDKQKKSSHFHMVIRVIVRVISRHRSGSADAVDFRLR